MLVWALSNPDALGRAAREALAGSPFTASVANLWELVLKTRKAGAPVAEPLPWWEKYVVRSGIRLLSIRTRHVVVLARLPTSTKTRLTVSSCAGAGRTPDAREQGHDPRPLRSSIGTGVSGLQAVTSARPNLSITSTSKQPEHARCAEIAATIVLRARELGLR